MTPRISGSSAAQPLEKHLSTAMRQAFHFDRIFKDNLAICKLCLEYSLSFADVAYPLRDENGDLREDLCSDAGTYAYHLNDAGCGVWIDFLDTLLSD